MTHYFKKLPSTKLLSGIKNISFLLLTIVLFWSTAEIALKVGTIIWNPASKEESLSKYDNPAWMIERKYNREGFRDSEHTPDKPRNVFRILVLGDSQAFGLGIDNQEDIFPEKLESYLNREPGSHEFEIINMSDRHTNTEKEILFLLKYGLKYDPDLVLVAYNHNDIPVPERFHCNSTSKDLLFWGLDDFFKRSNFFLFLKTRINRLLEKTGFKPSSLECMVERYNSFGWEIEQNLLDVIWDTCRIRNINLMLTVMPWMDNLGENYPYKKPHLKLAEYAKKREIEFLDPYEKGFKGLDASQFRLSYVDEHFNEKGADLISKILYKRLKNLNKFKNLNLVSKVFSLSELLDEDFYSLEADKALDLIKDGDYPLIFSKNKTKGSGSNNTGLKIWKESTEYYFQIIKNHKQEEIIRETILDGKGGFIKKSIISRHLQTNEKTILESISLEGNKYIVDNDIKDDQSWTMNKNRKAFVFKVNFYEEKGITYDTFEIEESMPYLHPATLDMNTMAEKESDFGNSSSIAQLYLYFIYSNSKEYVQKMMKKVLSENPTLKNLKAICQVHQIMGEHYKIEELLKGKNETEIKYIKEGLKEEFVSKIKNGFKNLHPSGFSMPFYAKSMARFSGQAE